MTMKYRSAAGIAAAFALFGCGAHNVASSPTSTLPNISQDAVLESPVIDATVTPLLIHVGFNHAEHTDPTFGPVYFYSPMVSGVAQVIRVRTNSKVIFINDDPSGVSHTASGFGPSSFPTAFDNTSGTRRVGTIVNGSRTWSSGALSHGQRSQVFTIGPRGHYFFGCAFHYTTRPTKVNGSMGDVIVSM